MITSIKSPFLEYKMTILRDKKTSNSLFRQTMNEASYLIAAEVLKNLKYKNKVFIWNNMNCWGWGTHKKYWNRLVKNPNFFLKKWKENK